MATIQQWVNLDPTDATQRNVPGVGTIPPERCGKMIKLRAKIKPALRRKRVYWAVQLGADNISPNLDPANHRWHHHTTMGGFGAPGFYEKMVRTNRKGVSVTAFHLSECGGDEFTIKAYTKTRRGKVKKELKSDTYVVWRQLFYQVTRMRAHAGHTLLPAIPNIDWAGVKAEYDDSRKPHHIRLSEVPAASPMISRHRSLYNETMIKKTGLEGYDRSREPLVTKVSLVDLLAEKTTFFHSFRVVRESKSYELPLDDVLFDMNSRDSKKDWFVSIRAFRPGDTSRRVPIGRGNVRKTGPSTVTLDMGGIPKEGLLDFFRKATVHLTVNVFTDWTLGFSWYNGVWVNNAVVNWTDPPTIRDETIANKVATMVHEIGHAIGMVPTASPFHYPTSHDHVGNHCWNGATDPSTFPAGDDFPSPTGAVCTMFGDNSSNTEKFCDTCSPFVRSLRPDVDGNFKASLMMPVGWA